MCLSALQRAAARLPPAALLAIFTFINVLNYLDRGLIPGMFDDVGAFIRADLNVSSDDVQLGLLQSLYIVGYGVASLTFGHLARSQPPFKLMALGLAIWVLAAVLSGLAPRYWVLALARMLSGVGEASFQTVVPPFIDDIAPPARRGLWLSIFFTAIPVGTAVGYAFGGNVSALLGWRWAFFLEAMPMAPFVPLVFLLPFRPGARGAAAAGASGAKVDTPLLAEAAGDAHAAGAEAAAAEGVAETGGAGAASGGSLNAASAPPASEDTAAGARISFAAEISYVLCQPLYLAVVFGYAGFTAVLSGIGSFGPTIVEGLGIVPTQAGASLAFGAAVSGAGILGTPIGGLLLDYGTRRWRRALATEKMAAQGGGSGDQSPTLADDAEPRDRSPTDAAVDAEARSIATDAVTILIKLNVALPQAVIFTLIGLVACMAGILLGTSLPFFLLLSVGATSLCLVTAGVNQAIMASVRPSSRSFAIGLGTLLVHLFGDVPAPPIIGQLADSLSPQSCPPGGGACQRSAHGLQVTLAITLLWLGWPILLWSQVPNQSSSPLSLCLLPFKHPNLCRHRPLPCSVAWLIAARRERRRRAESAAGGGGEYLLPRR